MFGPFQTNIAIMIMIKMILFVTFNLIFNENDVSLK